MPRIFTHPDIDLNVNVPKIMILNADWDDNKIQEIVNVLSEKEYDIYLHHSGITDVQWEYGVKDKSRQILDARHYATDPTVWLKEFDDGYTP